MILFSFYILIGIMFAALSRLLPPAKKQQASILLLIVALWPLFIAINVISLIDALLDFEI